ncbi:MAG: hypothetical protein WC459_03485 [Patescibacteria group bacterium]
MLSDRAKLENFLILKMKDESVINFIMAELEPFFLMANRGRYIFKAANEVNSVQVARVIGKTINEHVHKIIFVSRTDPNIRPFRRSFVAATNLIPQTYVDIINLKQLSACLFECFGKSFWASLYIYDDDAQETLWHCLILFIIFAMFSYSIDRAKQLLPLIKMLTQAIPIGESIHEAGAWIIRVA